MDAAGIADLLWVLFAAVVVLAFAGPLRQVISQRDFNLEIGGLKVSAKTSLENLSKDVEDLRREVVRLSKAVAAHSPVLPEPEPAEEATAPAGSEGSPAATQAAAASAAIAATTATILWADDNPKGNASIIRSFRDLGIDVQLARTTDEAMKTLQSASPRISLVISDMGRQQWGLYRQYAGLDLLDQMRKEGFEVPVAFYTTRERAAQVRNKPQFSSDASSIVTASGVRLYRYVTSTLNIGLDSDDIAAIKSNI